LLYSTLIPAIYAESVGKPSGLFLPTLPNHYQHYQPLSYHTKWIPISKRFVWFKGYPSCLSTPITPPHSCTFTTQGRPSHQLQYPLNLYGFSYRRLTFACHSNYCNSVECVVSTANTSQFATLIYEYSDLIYFIRGKGIVTLMCPVNKFNSSKNISDVK
jgi:hypothetical protein